MGFVLGVDIGTQGTKGVLLDESLEVCASAYIEHDYIQPRQNWYEHNADETWWGGFNTIAQKVLEKIPASKKEISAIGCSALSPCMLPIDEQDKPLRNGILYGIDTRSKQEIS